MSVGVFHPGVQHSWRTARALQELGNLAWFATTIFYDPGKWPYRAERFLPASAAKSLHAEFLRFFDPGLNLSLVRRFGYHEWLERIAGRMGYRGLAGRLNEIGNLKFAEAVGDLCLQEPVDIVWGYDTASARTFQRAKKLGIRCVLDNTIGDPRILKRILAQERVQYPEFFSPDDRDVGPEQLAQLDMEYDLADRIVVGSEFCRNTLIDPAVRPSLATKIEVLNYCFDEQLFPFQENPGENLSGHPLRFIFVGHVNPRKGAHLLLEAFKTIPQSAASLTVLGPMQIPAETAARYSDRVQFHAPVARSQVRELMKKADCLILPSLFEGSSLVLLEALACGLGIIQSKNAGVGADETTGIVLTENTVEAVRAAVLEAVENPHRVQGWKQNSANRARQFTFAKYRDRIAALLSQIPATGVTDAARA